MSLENVAPQAEQWEEAQQLAVLARYGSLDTAPAEPFAELIQLSSMICGTPLAFLNLVEEEKRHCSDALGIQNGQPMHDTAIGLLFAAYGSLDTDLLLVPDIQQDPRFCQNPTLAGHADLRFYAGAPLISEEGLHLGMLCVMDRQPRQLHDIQKTALKLLAQQAVKIIHWRHTLILQNDIIEFLRSADERVQMALACGGVGVWDWDIIQNRVVADANYARLMNMSEEQAAMGLPVEAFVSHVYEGDRSRVQENLARMFAAHESAYAIEYRIVNPDGSLRWISSRGRCQYTLDKKPRRLIGCSYDLERHKPAMTTQFQINAAKNGSPSPSV